MTEATILTGLKRVLASAKVYVATTAATGLWVTARFAAPDAQPQQRAYLWLAFMGGIVIVAREVITAWSAEDVAVKSSPQSVTQISTGDNAPNVQQPPVEPPAVPKPVQLAGAVQTPPPGIDDVADAVILRIQQRQQQAAQRVAANRTAAGTQPAAAPAEETQP